ncbi:hypothetical protein MBLNU230_g4245t1 [Neophaeotheca triangularis]
MAHPPTPDRRASLQETDSATLALLGKKQVLKRRFGFFSLFAFAVCELITWETTLALFSEAFENGGPAGAVYGFIIAWFSTLSVYTVISELASMAPISGGQYYWVYMLAPPEYKRIASYLIGWLTTLAWVATVATETLFAGTIIQGILVLDYPSYDSQQYQGTLLTWAVIAVCIFINVVIPNWLPRFEVFILVFHLAGFVAILVTLLVMTPSFASNETVWRTSLNTGGWPTQGLSYCVGFLGNVATFVGADASVHLAEEVSNAALNIPRAILSAMLINGAVGFAMMITILYCLNDIEQVLNTPTGFPFIQIFSDSVRNTAGATVMAALVLALTWACATGITTTASRMAWSFARDRGVPFADFLMQVNPRTKVPVRAVFAVTGLAALLTCIYIGSSTAFNDVVSLTITGFYGSYLIPAAFLLNHRIKGSITLPSATKDDETPAHPSSPPITTKTPRPQSPSPIPHQGPQPLPPVPLTWGPWHLPGWPGIANNVYACAYMGFVIFWSVWPPATPVTAESMNYSVVVTGGVLIFSAGWYIWRGRGEYSGPLVDEEVVEVLRGGGG